MRRMKVVPQDGWIKSSRSAPSGNCVELKKVPAVEGEPDGEQDILMRNSRYPDGDIAVLTRGEFLEFLNRSKNGDFDHLIE